MLDEQALRRPGFKEGTPVVLADGQAWHLRRPVVRFVPSDSDVGFRACLSLARGDGYDALLTAWQSAAEAAREDESASARAVAAELALGRAVLTANYDLTTEQLAELLQFGFDPDDEEAFRIRSEVLAAATGDDPKPSAGGGGSPPTPPA